MEKSLSVKQKSHYVHHSVKTTTLKTSEAKTSMAKTETTKTSATKTSAAKTSAMKTKTTTAPLLRTLSKDYESKARHGQKRSPRKTKIVSNLTSKSSADLYKDAIYDIYGQDSHSTSPGPLPDIDQSDSDEEYDTDMENEERPAITFDKWGRTAYRKTCQRLKVNPITYIDRQLSKSRLVMRGHGLRPKDTLALAVAMLENTTVTELILENNHLVTKAHIFCAGCYQRTPTSENCLAENDVGNEGAHELISVMADHRSIYDFNLSENRLDDGVIPGVCAMLQHNRVLTTLNLSHNNLGNDAGYVLGEEIALNKTLRRLDISWNKIRPAGMIPLLCGLEKNITLKDLNLAMNGLSIKGAIAVAKMLKSNITLRTLDISCTRIPDTGAREIGRALAENQTLSYLMLHQNLITASGAAAVLEGLKMNKDSAMRNLDLSTVHVLQPFMDDLAELTSCGRCLTVRTGGVVSNCQDMDGVSGGNSFYRRNPLTILRWYVSSHGLRLIDLFNQLDKDKAMSVSRQDFVNGLRSIEVPLSDEQMDRLINMLDKDGDGQVDYGELMEGDKMQRLKDRRTKEKKRESVHQQASSSSPASTAVPGRRKPHLQVRPERARSTSPHNAADNQTLHNSRTPRMSISMATTGRSLLEMLRLSKRRESGAN